MIWRVVAGVGPGRADRQRHPVPVDQQRVLRALFPAVHGAGAGLLAAAEGPHDDAVDDDRVGVELAGLPQQPQQVGVQAVPDAQLLPGPQPAVGGPAGAAHLRRDVLPAAAGGQDEPDDPDDDAVADAGPPALGADGLLRRQVVADDLEELIGHVGCGHGCVPRGFGLSRHGAIAGPLWVLSAPLSADLLVEMGREHANACPGKALGVFDGGFALRSVVRPLVVPAEPGQPRVDVLTRLRHDARLHDRPPAGRRQGQRGATPKWGKHLPPPRQGGRWRGAWRTGTASLYGRHRQVEYKEVVCLWRVLGHDVAVKAIIARVEGYRKRFTLVTSATDLSGVQMLELFCARFRQEDAFRDLKQRVGWEECRAWTRNPIEQDDGRGAGDADGESGCCSSSCKRGGGTTGGCTRRGTRTRRGRACWTWSGCCGSDGRNCGKVWRPGWTAREIPGAGRDNRRPCDRSTSPWWAKATAADARRSRPASRCRGFLTRSHTRPESPTFTRTH